MRQLLRTTVTVFVVLVFTAGMAFAQQNDSEVTQDGTSNEATITQEHTGTQGTNVIDADQDGTDNEIRDFRQFGSGNETIFEQNGTGNIVRNPPEQGSKSGGPNGASYNGYFEVDQDGTGNIIHDADQIGFNNDARIQQSGTGNFADVETQLSTSEGGMAGNVAQISQMGTENAVGDMSGNRGVHQQGTQNELYVTQTGSGNIGGEQTLNEAGVSPFGPNSLLGSGEQAGGNQPLVQAGTDNSLTITQDGQDVIEFVLQNGSGNAATISQMGGSATNRASLIQRGSGNSATVTQN